MSDAVEIGMVLIAIVVFLGFLAFADKQTDLDEKERDDDGDT